MTENQTHEGLRIVTSAIKPIQVRDESQPHTCSNVTEQCPGIFEVQLRVPHACHIRVGAPKARMTTCLCLWYQPYPLFLKRTLLASMTSLPNRVKKWYGLQDWLMAWTTFATRLKCCSRPCQLRALKALGLEPVTEIGFHNRANQFCIPKLAGLNLSKCKAALLPTNYETQPFTANQACLE